VGGQSYNGDVEQRSRSSSDEIFTYHGYGPDATSSTKRRAVHPELNPLGKNIECTRATPIVVTMDVTRSRGDDSKIVYSKLPMFIGQIDMKGYVSEPSISFAAIGDAFSGDQAPIQIGAFAHDNTLDDMLSKIWLEGGGGGTGQESYELITYFYARHCQLSSLTKNRKGFFFFCGDEGFYQQVDRNQVKIWIGDDLEEDISSTSIFAELQEKFHVFLIYPQKAWDERKRDIDAEIKTRVESAGGRYDDVDIRASLIWNNRNDLDLRVFTPSGEEIFYGNKKSHCGGWLDVDMNVRGETTKPVENIRWAKGEAPPGHYSIYVQNYAFHEEVQEQTEFRVEVHINGEVHYFNGVISPNRETGPASNIAVYEFNYEPNLQAQEGNGDNIYVNYSDSVVKKQWASVIPLENILVLEDPNSIIDVALGALCLVEGTRDLNGYIADMKGRGQTQRRCDQTRRALEDLASASNKEGIITEDQAILNSPHPTRGGRLKRL
jgi:hypothetical protein